MLAVQRSRAQAAAAPPPQRVAFSRRRRHRLRRIAGEMTAFSLLLLLVGGLAAFTLTSPLFGIREIRINGLHVLTEEQVCAVAGLKRGSNLLLLNPEEIAARVAAMPAVAHCTVTRTFPDVVQVDLIERRAAATILINNHAFDIDFEGHVIEEVDLSRGHAGALITGLSEVGYVEAGQRIDLPELRQALELAAVLRAIPLPGNPVLSEIAANKKDEIITYFAGLPFEIRWGRGDFTLQARRLRFLWSQLGGAPPCREYLDLRFGNDLVCK